MKVGQESIVAVAVASEDKEVAVVAKAEAASVAEEAAMVPKARSDQGQLQPREQATPRRTR